MYSKILLYFLHLKYKVFIFAMFISVLFMNRFLQKVIDEARQLVKDEIGVQNCSKIFNIDYSNMCAYVRGSKVMPPDLACEILDYMDCRVVVFQSKKRF